jgi:hypothetical protein
MRGKKIPEKEKALLGGLIFITAPSGCRDTGHIVTPVAMIIPILSSEKHHQCNCKPATF